MVMNRGLQEFQIKRKLKNAGVRPDKVDYKALIDSSLTLPENWKNIREEIGISDNRPERPVEVRERISENQIKQAVEYLKNNYSETQAEADTGITAKKTFKPPLTEEEFQTYINNPASYDIEGVDTADDFLQVELGFEM
jgi:hypothetical protein